MSSKLRPHSHEDGHVTVDYNIHGVAGIRLKAPSDHDIGAVNDAIGDMRGPLPAAEPDLTIRFIADIPIGGVLCHVEPGETAYAGDSFFVVGEERKAPAASIPLDLAGGPCEIVCRSNSGAVPLLRPIIDLVLLRRGVAAVHASAFSYNGNGAIVAGWARGAKTTALLAFMSQGAEFIADDRVYVDPLRDRVFGLRNPISIRLRHLHELPEYKRRLGGGARLQLRLLAALAGSTRRATRGPRATAMHRFATRLARLVDDAAIEVPSEQLFEKDRGSTRPSRVYLSIAHGDQRTVVERVDFEWMAERLSFAIRAERHRLMARYHAFRFAFPDRPNETIEAANELERKIVTAALGNCETYVLYHPFPPSAQGLVDAVRPTLE